MKSTSNRRPRSEGDFLVCLWLAAGGAHPSPGKSGGGAHPAQGADCSKTDAGQQQGKIMSIEPKEPCGTCGSKPVLTMCDRKETCAECGGTGAISFHVCKGNTTLCDAVCPEIAPCQACQATGYVSKTADIIGGWCRQCGRLGPMRSEVQDACAAWDADQATPCERIEGVILELSVAGYFAEISLEPLTHKLQEGDRVLIVRKGGKA
jgi:hypothetical protein